MSEEYSGIKNLPQNITNEKSPLDGRKPSSEEIEEILSLYNRYEGNAAKASKNERYTISTILRYWKKAGFKINRPGFSKGSILNPEKHQKYEELFKNGFNDVEIAGELGVTKQSVNGYRKRHNFHSNRESMLERSLLIKRLFGEGKTNKEVADKLKISQGGLSNYLLRHPELKRPSRPKGKTHGHYNPALRKDIKDLIEAGLNQEEIGEKLDRYQSQISFVIRTTPDLKQSYLEHKDTRKQRRDKLK